MTTPAIPPITRVHHVPEAVYGLVAAVAVLGANSAVMALWWWTEQDTADPARTWLIGALTALLLVSVLILAVRHPIVRRAAVGVIAMAVVVDAIVIGYQLSGTALIP